MVRYRCASCSFKFDSAKPPKKCPYCSREGSIKEEESAEFLVSNIDKMLE